MSLAEYCPELIQFHIPILNGVKAETWLFWSWFLVFGVNSSFQNIFSEMTKAIVD